MVSYIPSATIPASRLSKILENMFLGQPLSALSLSYLQQQNLAELYRLAVGKISYEDYIVALGSAGVLREQAAKAKHHAQQAERSEQERKWRVEAQCKRDIAKAERTAPKADVRRAQHKRDREAADAARLSFEATWEQYRQSCEVAEVAYKLRISEPGYLPPTAGDIARYFRLDDLEKHTELLRNILSSLYQGRPLPRAHLDYLKFKSLQLYELAIGQITYESYISGIDAAEATRIEQAEAARIAKESDPAYIIQKECEVRCRRYGIAYSSQLPAELIRILDKLEAGKALSAEEYVWLTTSGKSYFTSQIRRDYHRSRAVQCVKEFQRTKDIWQAVNGSGHFRKCDMAGDALQLLAQVDKKRLTSKKLKSAFFTTRGGVMRDLRHHNKAVGLGTQAHELTPKDFRPCTLLGALHMELGNYSLGHDWYEKAIALGATVQSVDSELKRIYAQADKATRERMKTFLLAEDADRFCWVDSRQTAIDRSAFVNHAGFRRG